MKFYDCKTAPSPRRVRIFLAEKGITPPTEQVDLRGGEHLSPAYRAINPWCVVPWLVLDDGTGIGETMAICRYFEEIHPEPPLMGIDARDKALVTMWDRRVEFDGFLAVAEVLRNTAKGMKGRALAGPDNYDQIPALAERGRARLKRFYDILDRQLAGNTFVAGPRFSVADITALCAVDFAGWIGESPPEEHANLWRWHAAVAARPSAGA